MTDTASLKLCQRLNKLSGWEETKDAWCEFKNGPELWNRREAMALFTDAVPAYTLNDLMRKLEGVKLHQVTHDVTLRYSNIAMIWYCGIHHYGAPSQSDTPADAAAKLCIKLWKEKVLK